MLILSRKLNEQIVIGDQIVITVVAIRGGNVRLGIDAPTSVPVHRKEIHDALSKQDRQTEPVAKKAPGTGLPSRSGENL